MQLVVSESATKRALLFGFLAVLWFYPYVVAIASTVMLLASLLAVGWYVQADPMHRTIFDHVMKLFRPRQQELQCLRPGWNAMDLFTPVDPYPLVGTCLGDPRCPPNLVSPHHVRADVPMDQSKREFPVDTKKPKKEDAPVIPPAVKKVKPDIVTKPVSDIPSPNPVGPELPKPNPTAGRYQVGNPVYFAPEEKRTPPIGAVILPTIVEGGTASRCCQPPKAVGELQQANVLPALSTAVPKVDGCVGATGADLSKMGFQGQTGLIGPSLTHLRGPTGPTTPSLTQSDLQALKANFDALPPHIQAMLPDVPAMIREGTMAPDLLPQAPIDTPAPAIVSAPSAQDHPALDRAAETLCREMDKHLVGGQTRDNFKALLKRLATHMDE